MYLPMPSTCLHCRHEVPRVVLADSRQQTADSRQQTPSQMLAKTETMFLAMTPSALAAKRAPWVKWALQQRMA
jgi:hypothetical protein